MNNKKILIAIILLIVILGTYVLVGSKKTSPKQTTQLPSTQPTLTQPTSTESAIKPIVVKEGNNVITNVILTNMEFMPKDIVIKAGSKVMWINKSGATADIESDNHPTHLLYPFLNLGKFESGTTLQAAFEKAGKYSYHNELNLSEIGTITVQ